MLPPVGTTSLFVDMPMSAQPPPEAARVTLLQAANDEDGAAMPVSAGRLGAMSLSGQLQLAQGFSIVAETIGAFLQLPRGENESLDDYARRIAAAVQALNPADQARLEASLSKLLRGLDLRFLAEVLKDPAGPDAARLAASLELSHARGKDLAAGAAVTSYRQNSGTASPPPSSLIAASPTAPSTSPLAPAVADAAAGPAAASVMGSIPPTPGTNLPAASPSPGAGLGAPVGQDAAPAPPASQSPSGSVAQGAGSMPAPAITAPQPLAPAWTVPGSPVPAAPPVLGGPLQTERSAIALPLEPQEFERVRGDAIAVANILARHPAASLGGGFDSGTLPVTVGIPTSVSPAQLTAARSTPHADMTMPTSKPPDDRAVKVDYAAQAQDIVRAARSLGNNAVIAVVEWLAEVFPTKTPLPSAGPVPPKPERSPLDALVAQLIQGHPEALAPSEPARLPIAAETAANTRPADNFNADDIPGIDRTHTGSAVSAPAEASGKPPEGPDLPAFALPVFVPREGFPIAYVPYPPASNQKQDRGGRKTKEVTKVDDEGEEPPHGGHQPFHGQGRDQGKPGEKLEQGSGGEAEPEGDPSAQDLYLRMMDWT